MSTKNDKGIPPQQIASITLAIEHAYPGATWEVVKLLHGGMSGGYTYLVEINATPYVIKLENLETEELDLERYCKVIYIASHQEFCPKVHYADAKSGVVLMDYCEPDTPKPMDESRVKRLAAKVRKVHEGQPLPQWLSIFDIFEYVYNKIPIELSNTKLIKKCVLEAREIKNKIYDEKDIKPCHGDLNPSNEIFKGEKLYFVDWMTASPQCFYFDLATCLIFFFHSNINNGDLFIKSYFQRPLDAIELEKLKYMIRFASIYYGIGFLSLSTAQDKKAPFMSEFDQDKLPEYKDFMIQVRKGVVDLSNPIEQQRLGFILLNND